MRSLYTAAVAGLLFPLQERLKGHETVRARRFLEQSQWLDLERLASLQLARLRALLEHAARHVPYYRGFFAQHRFDPREVRGLADLERLPLLTKAEIRSHFAALQSDTARDLARFNTGGSSGEPLIFLLGKERISHDVAAKWRATRWWGVDIGDREIVLWGSPIELGAQDRLKGLRDALMRTELLPAFEMSERKLDAFAARLRRRRPKMLFGYPSALAHLARHAAERGIALDDVGINVAFVTGEKLYDEQRALIARTFACAVANGYGGRDAGFIAHECPAGGMHITAEDVVVEIIADDGQPVPRGSPGEIVITHLASRDFPFIRYRTGDIGVLSDEKCPCGRGLPLLKNVEGRSTDFIVAQDGTVMHGLALIYAVRDIPGVCQFKVIQETLDRTRVLLATDAHFRESDLETIRRGLAMRLGETVRVDIERVSAIAPEASGKYRYVLSRVETRRTNRIAA